MVVQGKGAVRGGENMKVRVRDGGNYLSVDVSDAGCPGLACFWIATRIQRSAPAFGGSGTATWSTKSEPRCGRRDQTGCPAERQQNPKWILTRGVWKKARS